jgi:ferrous iron transport protein B
MLLAILMGFIFKKTLFKGEAPMFIMELPPYRMPSFTSLCCIPGKRASTS